MIEELIESLVENCLAANSLIGGLSFFSLL
jgi:hypothetical protein